MDKKLHIQQIATTIFSERGFENTPIDLICEKSGVSKGLVFYHFKSKKGLLREIYASTTSTMSKLSEPQAHNLHPKDELLELINGFFHQLYTNKNLLQFNLSIMIQPSTKEILGTLIEERSSLLFNTTKKLFTKINPKNATVLSYVFIAELDGIALNYLSVFKDYPLKEIQQQITNKYSNNEFYKNRV